MNRVKQEFSRFIKSIFVRPRHWFSWLAGIVVAGAMVIAIVPGTPSSWNTHRADRHVILLEATMVLPDGAPMLGGSWSGDTPPWPHSVFSYHHGWPLVHAVTAIGRGGTPSHRPPRVGYVEPLYWPGGWPISWGSRNAWLFESDAIHWIPHAIVVNLLVAMLLTVSTVMFTEHWLRARGGLLRFRLIDLLVGITLLAIAFGWCKHHKLRYASEQLAMTEEYAKRGFRRGYPDHHVYNIAGPILLTKLLGSEEYFYWRAALSEEDKLWPVLHPSDNTDSNQAEAEWIASKWLSSGN